MRVLIVSAHPDDEVLGCGGTILYHKKRNDFIAWLIFTRGWEPRCSSEWLEKREKEIGYISGQYGCREIIKMNYKSSLLDVVGDDELISRTSEVIRSVRPEVVYMPFGGDVHSDHRKVFDSVYASVKSFNSPYIRKVLAYETISSTEFAPPLDGRLFYPNVFVDISDYIEEKLSLCKVYESEFKQPPHPRSLKNVEAWATVRGSMAGFMYAEAFMLIKERVSND